MKLSISIKKIHIIAWIIFILSIIPVLLLAKYSFPSADDFSAGRMAHEAWRNTGSFWQAAIGAGKNVIYNYENWSGVYASVFWTSLHAGIFNEKIYGLTTVIVIGMLIVGVVYSFQVILTQLMGIKKEISNILALLYLFMVIQNSVNASEAYYWHAGAINYTFAFGLMLCMTGTVIRAQMKNHHFFYTTISCLLAVLVGGGNYITALCSMVLLVFLCVISFIKKQKRSNSFSVLITAIVLLLSFLVSVLAPGNQVRMSVSTGGLSPIKAIATSFYYCMTYTIKEWMCWPVLFVLLLAIPIMLYAVRQTKFDFRYPILVILGCYCLASSAFTPCLYATGNVDAGRVQNTVYAIVLLMIFISEFYLIGWFGKRILEKNKIFFSKKIEMGCLAFTGLVIVLDLAFSLFTVRSNPDIYTGTLAAYAMLKGQTKVYEEENEKRLELLYSDMSDIELQPHSDAPTLLRFQDVTSDKGDWLNISMAKYYNKQFITLSTTNK